MPTRWNQEIAGQLEEVAQILQEQKANPFRAQAYRKAAAFLRTMPGSVRDLFAAEGLAGLEKLPGVGPSIARAIQNILRHGRLAMLERLRGEHDPVALLSSVPGISPATAHILHDDLDIGSLEELEAAAHDGRLEQLAGIRGKRLAGIRDTLAHRLGRPQTTEPPPPRGRRAAPHQDAVPAVGEILGVDAEYRRLVRAGSLPKIAPRRFNPKHEAWLPILHTSRGGRHYTALFSNTARAHQQGKTDDWVVMYFDGDHGERQCTVITGAFGRLRGHRLVRGREHECEGFYDRETAAKLAHG